MKRPTAHSVRKAAAIMALMSSAGFAGSYWLDGLNGPPRGVANYNPGNVKMLFVNGQPKAQGWLGSKPTHKNTDGTFEQFTAWRYGIRAMIKVLQNGYFKAGFNTLNKLIARYAPKSENDTGNYVRYVSQQTGFRPNQVIQPTAPNLLKLIKAMIAMEIGTRYAAQIPISEYKAAFDMIDTLQLAKRSGAGVLIAGGLGFGLYLARKYFFTQQNDAG